MGKGNVSGLISLKKGGEGTAYQKYCDTELIVASKFSQRVRSIVYFIEEWRS